VRAAVIADGALQVVEQSDPEPGRGQVLVRIRAAGVNGADIAQRAGYYPAPPGAPADIPGLELAGEVVALGDGVTSFDVGDRVMALVGGGGHAELAAVPMQVLLRVPDGIDWPAAGGFVEVFATAYDALFSQARLALGERLLVNGAAGGVGVAGVQLAVAAGASVVATVRSEAARPRVAELGAEVVAPGGAEGSFDVVLELVGGDALAHDVELLGYLGRLVVIGVGAGSRAEIDFRHLMGRRLSISASMLRGRKLEEKALVVRALERHVLPLLAAGRVRVPVEETFPLAEAQAAYDRFVAGGKFGKVVLLMDG
jgi:NADPH:quinone reductase-like Zn-dependent oxidoreductase